MTASTEHDADVPVRKSVTVKASQQRAFEVFTAEFDSWWPRSHHIGPSPMTATYIEGRVGGRCHSAQENGTDCEWGSILVWEPPQRFVLAWQISLKWTYEPEIAKSSEVEVRFTPLPDGFTRVDLEHRFLARHGADFEAMRRGIDAPEGWNGLMQLFKAKAEAA